MAKPQSCCPPFADHESVNPPSNWSDPAPSHYPPLADSDYHKSVDPPSSTSHAALSRCICNNINPCLNHIAQTSIEVPSPPASPTCLNVPFPFSTHLNNPVPFSTRPNDPFPFSLYFS
ncbi:uncharacterized protein HD556DRAFT_1448991 [Suillus plorans]|uniref:Uncharacterized protein n=1 Tax=Suillus plorans TaxID=116603 RepID=A0A9P7DCF9_9AGAM|nr:uncharacterized protein HD556DRAFT_1448991 [Suillus plorans]KAG1787197.1 hypothetical protein HD556DRAFT_1448991 [Suillus plorans]